MLIEPFMWVGNFEIPFHFESDHLPLVLNLKKVPDTLPVLNRDRSIPISVKKKIEIGHPLG